MIIPVTFNPPSSTTTSTHRTKLPEALAKISHDEVVLIELQGSLEVECPQPADKNGKLVGKLTINEGGSGKPTLVIGHHLLEGKIASLTKPLAILTRSTTDATATATASSLSSRDPCEDRGDDLQAMDCDDNESGEGGQGAKRSPQTQWVAVGVVKRKIVFAKRPMPIVGNPS